MAALNNFYCFLEDLAEARHNLGSDQLSVALMSAANPPLNTNTTLSNLTQISYTNLSSRNVTTVSSTQTLGVYKLVLNDLVISASGVTSAFRYVALYNDTSASKLLIGWSDYGQELSLNNGETFTLDFDGINGALSISWS